MSAAPLVSVLITTYNREKYLAASIESVLAQTFGDFEIVITDNVSTDATFEIAKAYERLDARIRVSRNERNIGQFPNRNRAASLARGRLLKFHDSDDLMYPHCLAVMVPLLQAETAAGFALSAGAAWPGAPCPMLSTPRMSYQREFLGFGLFMCGPASALFRSEVFRELGGFVDIGIPSDHLFWLKACARYPVLLLPADLFWYRQHADQLIQAPHAAREYAEMPGHVWRALNAPECPLDGEELEQAKRNQAFGTAKQIYRHVRRRQWALALRRCARSGLTAADWVHYLRPPRRSWLAGSALDAQGEYVIPEWVRAAAQVPR